MLEVGLRGLQVTLVLTILLIFISSYVTQLIGIEEWWVTALLTSALAVIPIGTNIYYTQREQRARKFQVRSLVRDTLKFIESFVTSKPKVDEYKLTNQIIDENPELIRNTTFDPLAIATAVFEKIGTKEKSEQLGILTLCFEIEQGKTIQDYYTIIQNYTTSRDLFNPKTDEGKKFLTLYHEIFIQKQRAINVKQITDFARELSTEELVSTARFFLKKYVRNAVLEFFETRLGKSEELRETLIKLIREGKLPTIGVWKKAVIQIQQALDEKQITGQLYLLITNQTGRRIGLARFKDLFQKRTRIAGTGWATSLPNNRKSHRFGVFLIKTKRNYPSVQDFIRTEIEHKIASVTGYTGLASVYRLNLADSITFNVPRDTKLQKNMLKGWEILQLFREGGNREVDILSILNRSELDTEELISVLPFNLLVPDISHSERGFLVANYDRVKEAFGISKLTDWRNIDPLKLSNFLTSLGLPDYNTDELRARFGVDSIDKLNPEIIRERYESISEQIVKNSKLFYDSLQGLVI